MKSNWTDYDRKIIITPTHSAPIYTDEFIKFLQNNDFFKSPEIKFKYKFEIDEDDYQFICDDTRINSTYIDLIERYGVDKCVTNKNDIHIKSIPAYYNYSVTEYDGAERLHLEFPFKDLVKEMVEAPCMNKSVLTRDEEFTPKEGTLLDAIHKGKIDLSKLIE